jgi:hypothetical protein
MVARFFRSDAMSERLGETEDVLVESREFFQLTYNHLRDMEGEIIAEYDSDAEEWRRNGVPFSDVVIYLFDE